MKFSIPYLFSKSDKNGRKGTGKVKSADDGGSTGSPALWVGTTVVFALLFFLSSVLDMKVHVSFGQVLTTPAGAVQLQSNPSTVSPSTGGSIPTQVGGC
jgi:hypothetical protein